MNRLARRAILVLMTKHRVHIKCFGCQMNKLDTSLVTAALTEADFALTDTRGKKVRLSEYRDQKNVLLVFNRGFL